MSNDIISDTSSGDIICRSCGIVLGDRIISEEAEWKDYLEDDRGTSGEGARSSMIPIDEDHVTVITGGNQEECELLNRLQNQTTKKELKMYESLDHLEELTFKLGINDAIMVSVDRL
jgi:transcription initiation factor TFIIIB Brf1 subunit/transcription initiation factor TFIIB